MYEGEKEGAIINKQTNRWDAKLFYGSWVLNIHCRNTTEVKLDIVDINESDQNEHSVNK